MQSRGYLTFDDGDAQFRAARPGVVSNFRITRHDGLAGKHLQTLVLAETALDDAVFERVKTDHGDASAGTRRIDRAVEALAQRAKLVVDRDAQRLKRSRGRMN